MDPYNTADAYKPQSQPAASTAPAASAGSTNPYAAPSARVAQPVAASGEFTKASRGARLAAVMIDGIAYVVGFIPVFQKFIVASRGRMVPDYSALGTAGLGGLVIFLGVFAFNLYLIHRSGQTIGKKLLGIRIVRTDGSPASLGRVFALRMFVPGLISRIPLVGPFFSLANALVIFGSEKRCIHDYFADTVVVDA
jgi:uncharacterized RDD family membrane protein YckC